MGRPRVGERKRYNRTWTLEQKLRIVAEYDEARARDKELGVRGSGAAVCEKYNISTVWITLWRKEIAKKGIIDEGSDVSVE